MISESRKRANAKWDKENMTVIGCRIRRDKAEAFKEICSASGTSPNAVFLSTVNAALDVGKLSENQSRCVSASGDILTPSTLELATKAAHNPGKTPETVSEFLERAVKKQNEIDNAQIRMGVDPVTGAKMNRDAAAPESVSNASESPSERVSASGDTERAGTRENATEGG